MEDKEGKKEAERTGEKEKNWFQKLVDDKLSSPFWRNFLISWCLWNWKIFYVTFLVDADLLLKEKGLLKMDYISDLYSVGFICFFSQYNIWYTTGNILLNFGLNLFYHLLFILFLPLVSSFVIVFVVPIIANKFFERYEENETSLKIFKAQEKQRYLNEEKNVIEAKIIKIKAETELIETEENTQKEKKEQWKKEYEEFKKTNYFNYFYQIKESIYSFRGMVYAGKKEIVSVDVKAYCNVNGLIEVKIETKDVAGINDYEYEAIFLTEKGNYFMRRYLDDIEEIKEVEEIERRSKINELEKIEKVENFIS